MCTRWIKYVHTHDVGMYMDMFDLMYTHLMNVLTFLVHMVKEYVNVLIRCVHTFHTWEHGHNECVHTFRMCIHVQLNVRTHLMNVYTFD